MSKPKRSWTEQDEWSTLAKCLGVAKRLKRAEKLLSAYLKTRNDGGLGEIDLATEFYFDSTKGKKPWEQ